MTTKTIHPHFHQTMPASFSFCFQIEELLTVCIYIYIYIVFELHFKCMCLICDILKYDGINSLQLPPLSILFDLSRLF